MCKGRVLKLERLKKRPRKTEKDLDNIIEKNIKDRDLQIKMIENQNE